MTNYHDRLAQRRLQFTDRWLLRLEATANLVHNLKVDPGQAEVLKQVTRDFHQLVGAAGIYELDEICHLAIETEDMCRDRTQNMVAPTDAQVEFLQTALAKLTTLLAAIRQNN